jgi:hypothetical protein
MTLQPLYGSNAAQMVPMLLSNFSDVAAAVQQAASELRSGNQAILQSLEGRGLTQSSVSAQHGGTQHEASLTRQKSSECASHMELAWHQQQRVATWRPFAAGVNLLQGVMHEDLVHGHA